MNKIKAIICDWGGVYLEAGTDVALRRIYKIIDAPRQKIDKVFTSSLKKEGWLYRKGKLNEREFWEIAIKKLDIDEELIPEIKEAWYSSYTPIEGMKELISELRKNYKVIAFSGTIKERVEYLDKKYSLLEDFDDFILSFEVGFGKEDIGFYKVLVKKLEEMKLKPKECVFIDDHQEFLDVAESFGVETILFENPQKLKADLRRINVKI